MAEEETVNDGLRERDAALEVDNVYDQGAGGSRQGTSVQINGQFEKNNGKEHLLHF